MWWGCTPKQRCGITHPLLVMGHGLRLPKGKNPTSLTRFWWWVYIIKKTACHSHPIYHAMGCNSLKKYMATDTLWDEWHKGVQQRKGTVSLTFCWSWGEMWWYLLEEKFTHFLLVMEWDHLKGENFTLTYILLFMWRGFKLSCTGKCDITYNLLNIKWQAWGCVVTKLQYHKHSIDDAVWFVLIKAPKLYNHSLSGRLGVSGQLDKKYIMLLTSCWLRWNYISCSQYMYIATYHLSFMQCQRPADKLCNVTHSLWMK